MSKVLLRALLIAIAIVTLGANFAVAQDEEERFERLIADAYRAYNEGKYDKALDMYFEAKIVQDIAEVDYSIARTYHKLGECESAEKFYGKVLERLTELPEEYEGKVNKHLTSLPETCIPKKEDPEPVKVVETPVETPTEPQPREPVPPVDEGGVDWLSVGIMAGGGALLLGGLITDISGASLVDDHEKYSSDPTTGTDAERQAKLATLEDDISTRSIIAITLYGLGGAALVTGTVLLVLNMGDDSDATAANDWQLAPTVSDNGGALFLSTTF